ncbi:hypothetical protein BHE90_001013 [Fusarium euwallaceae]|uniref:Uncharacterized protein n=1 Tax=Fusarium euwallaceae TaxID=1147111 RepID=A0A430M954_9HYPO|nr:hypothetical protein BHE90_001013 [Fusarium euwallaceae]
MNSETSSRSASKEVSNVDVERGDGVKWSDKPNFIKPVQRSNSILFNRSTSQIGDHRAEDDVEGEEFRLRDLNIDVKRIVDSLRPHVLFRVKEGYEMKNLPKFDDMVRYGIREEEELELWGLEVHRLAAVAKSEEPPTLEGNAEWFGDADAAGYNRLHRLALQIQYAIDICIHDNELVLLQYHPQLTNESDYEFAHRRICRTFDEDRGSIRYERSIRIEKHNDEALHALVNYVTALMIRLLLRSMSGRFWIENCVSVLAKFAAKIKVVTADLPSAFERTLEAFRDFQIQVTQSPEARGVHVVEAKSSSGSDDDPMAKQQKALQEDIDTSGARYFMEMDAFRHSLSNMIEAAIADLSWNEEIEQPADVFETSSIVYDTGFHDRRTQLCRERDGAIGAAGERKVIDFAGVAFQIGSEVWETLSSSNVHGVHSYTTLTWSRKPFSREGQPKRKDSHDRLTEPAENNPTVHMAGMLDVIKALVPYLMYCGSFPTHLSMFTQLAVLISDPTNPVRYYKQKSFLTGARIHTSAYERNKNPKSSLLSQTVYDTEMARLARQGKPNRQLKEELEKAEKWTIDEKAIIIQHTWYSMISLGVCALLIAGGVALIAVEDMAEGVDPSNLTALAWAAAGFIMIFFKSRRVQDWPWRDFLRGRIVCRSITEVESVTGMDPQVLIAILLRLETRMFLKTRGPFNTLFSRKAEDGFSIDVPLLTSTVIDGGYIFVRVDSMSGPALVALGAKSYGHYESISPKGTSSNKQMFTCRDVSDSGRYLLNGESLALYPIVTNDLQWYRVRGVFATRACFD